MNEDITLVRKEDLESVLQTMLQKEEGMVIQVRKLLPLTTEEGLKKDLEKKLQNSLDRVQALRLGYVPVDTLGLWLVDTASKNKWNKKRLEEVLKDMPEELREAMEYAKAAGIFKSIKVTTQQGPDPMLVGVAGGKRFFIGAWLDLPLNRKIGVRILPKNRRLLNATNTNQS